MIEVTKSYILELPEGSEYIIYNPLTKQYKTEYAGKNDIAHNKHVYEGLKYFIKRQQ